MPHQPTGRTHSSHCEVWRSRRTHDLCWVPLSALSTSWQRCHSYTAHCVHHLLMLPRGWCLLEVVVVQNWHWGLKSCGLMYSSPVHLPTGRNYTPPLGGSYICKTVDLCLVLPCARLVVLHPPRTGTQWPIRCHHHHRLRPPQNSFASLVCWNPLTPKALALTLDYPLCSVGLGNRHHLLYHP